MKVAISSAMQLDPSEPSDRIAFYKMKARYRASRGLTSFSKVSLDFFRVLYRNCDKGFLVVFPYPYLCGSNLFFDVGKDLAIMPESVESHEKSTYEREYFFRPSLSSGPDSYRKSISQIPALWIDCDLPGMEEKAKASYPPSLVLHTSSPEVDRHHFFWILKQPAGRSRDADVIMVQQRLAKAFGGDRRMCDVSSLSRMPGTLNRLKYDPPHRVTYTATENQYSLEDFGDLPRLNFFESFTWLKALLYFDG